MSFKIQVKSQTKQFNFVHISKTLLDSVLAFGYPAPHQCRQGDCGSCKAMLLSGEIEHIDRPNAAITNEEKQNNVFLACSARPKADVELMFLDGISKTQEKLVDEDVGKATKKIAGTQGEIEDIKVENLKNMIVKIRLSNPIEFIPGQYMRFSSSRVSEARPYSIAEVTDNGTLVEFHIRYYADGLVSNYLVRHPIGDDVVLEGPFGVATYDDRFLHRDVVCICSGVGFAPVKSIIDKACQNKDINVRLLYFRREEKDVYDRVSILGFLRKYKNLQFEEIPTRKNDGSRNYAKDCIHTLIKDMSKSVVFVAGSDALVKDVSDAIIDVPGYSDQYYLTDSFIPFTPEIKEKKAKKGFFARLFFS